MVPNQTVGPSPFEMKLAGINWRGMKFNFNGLDGLYVGPTMEFQNKCYMSKNWALNLE